LRWRLIIAHWVQVVDHTFTAPVLVEVGHDTETVALARAVKLHVEKRVFLDDNKTVIFGLLNLDLVTDTV